MVSEAVLVALIVAVPTTLASLASFISSLRNSSKISDVHTGIDGRMEQLVKASIAQGRQEEREIARLDALEAGSIARTDALVLRKETREDMKELVATTASVSTAALAAVRGVKLSVPTPPPFPLPPPLSPLSPLPPLPPPKGGRRAGD
jgi:ribosomal protein S28E/S33